WKKNVKSKSSVNARVGSGPAIPNESAPCPLPTNSGHSVSIGLRRGGRAREYQGNTHAFPRSGGHQHLGFGILPKRLHDQSAELAALGPIDSFRQSHPVVGDNDAAPCAIGDAL